MPLSYQSGGGPGTRAMLVVIKRDGTRHAVPPPLNRHQVWPLLRSLRHALDLPGTDLNP
ncbi:MAG TPA: hypothetical protein VER17_15520 [Tepidisphaeraceae bacterium]|nr:hypothetical protein [Tepidisphaeraceae bacterium]